MNKKIKMMVFTEGTIIMHSNALNKRRKDIVDQVKKRDRSVHDFKSYIPIGCAPKKLKIWEKQSIDLIYLTSRKKQDEVNQIKDVLKKYDFPNGKLMFRKKDQEYKDVAEKEEPDILIEDDCESIGGKSEMAITFIKPLIQSKIKSIPLKEFQGIDQLPDKVDDLFYV
jgi:hypothetical protein